MSYGTRSADFYRYKLKCTCDSIPFRDEPPSYDAGREQISVEESRLNDLNFEEPSEVNQKRGIKQSLDGYESYIKQGLGAFDSIAAKVGDNLNYGATVVKQRADEAGVTQVL